MDELPAAESLVDGAQAVESLVADLRSVVWRQVVWQSAVYQADLVFRFQDGREVDRRSAAPDGCSAAVKRPA